MTKQQVIVKREKRPIKAESQKTVKQLLGELYADKVYLEKLLEDDRKLYNDNYNTINNSNNSNNNSINSHNNNEKQLTKSSQNLIFFSK